MMAFDYDSKTYLQFGLLQIAENPRLCAPGKKWADPPIYHPDVMDFVKRHPDVKWGMDALLGMPTFIFTSRALAEDFSALIGEDLTLAYEKARV